MNFLRSTALLLLLILPPGVLVSASTGNRDAEPQRMHKEAVRQSAHDNTLATIRRSDTREANGKLKQLTPVEHLRRANVYMSNRAFDEAREHWQALISYYPQHTAVPEALLGVGRSFYQARRYVEAYDTFDSLANRFPATKEGREGLNFSGSALLRMGRPAEAAAKYAEYIQRFPEGERAETAHLNMIDTLREAGRNKEAISWVTRTAQRFTGTPTETNALFGLLRLHVAEGDWKQAVSVADDLSRRTFSRSVLTSGSEVAYLRAFSLEQAGQRTQAVNAYLSISDSPTSYYGWLASERLNSLARAESRALVQQRLERVDAQIRSTQAQYPAPYRQAILRAAKARKIDPRFILAIIKQESVFKPLAKSPAGARGLLQLTIDAAQRYAAGAGLNALRESELYRPETSILVGSEYLAHLSSMFPKMLEPVAASYNGGEDNVARWVKRARHKDPGVFTSEVGFEETKGYVQKVMVNYRAYRQLYDADLNRK